jgi:hypothetical protein
MKKCTVASGSASTSERPKGRRSGIRNTPIENGRRLICHLHIAILAENNKGRWRTRVTEHRSCLPYETVGAVRILLLHYLARLGRISRISTHTTLSVNDTIQVVQENIVGIIFL